MRPSSTHRPRTLGTRSIAAAAAAGALVALATAQLASGATPIVNEPFAGGWTPGTQWAVSGTYTPQIVNILGQTPGNALRLTPATALERSSITYTVPQPTSGGLDIRFVVSEWGGTGANGMSFFLREGGDPSNAATAWTGGAGLGYVGLPGGLVGVGLDRYGGFPWTGANGTGCSTGTNAITAPNSIAIRGPGQPGAGDVQGTGFCLLPGAPNPWVVTNSPVGTPTIDFNGAGRTDGARAIRVTVDPSTVANPQIKVFYAPAANGTLTEVLSRDVPPELLAETTFKFGFAGATGGATTNNEIWDLRVSSLVDIPPVEITTASLPGGTVGTAYSCTTVAQQNGVAPVTFNVLTGSLPPGLTFNDFTGELCGTPTKSGTYAFTISAADSRTPNPSGTQKAYTIDVADSAPPCTPVNLASQAGVLSASVSWAPDASAGCAGVTSYEVEASDGRTCSATAPETKCTITDLPAGKEVRFRVRARNAIGISAWSEYGAPATPRAKPDASGNEVKPGTAVATGEPATSLTAIVVPVTTARAGMITVIGSSRESGRWFTRCVGRKRAADAGTRQVACVLTPAARRVLCVRPLRLRLLARIASDGKPVESTTRYVAVAKRACVGRVTG